MKMNLHYAHSRWSLRGLIGKAAALVLLVGCWSASDAQAQTASARVRVTGTNVRMRKQPSTQGEIYADRMTGEAIYPDKGMELPLLGERGDWYNIDYNGEPLWISKRFTARVADAAPTPGPAPVPGSTASALAETPAQADTQVAGQGRATVPVYRREVQFQPQTEAASGAAEATAEGAEPHPEATESTAGSEAASQPSAPAEATGAASTPSVAPRPEARRTLAWTGDQGQHTHIRLSLRIDEADRVQGECIYYDKRERPRTTCIVSGKRSPREGGRSVIELTEFEQAGDVRGIYVLSMNGDALSGDCHWSNGRKEFPLLNMVPDTDEP